MAFLEIDHNWYWQQGTQKRAISEWTRGRAEPFYLYDLAEIKMSANRYLNAFGRPVCLRYAMKANAHPAILRLMAQLNAGVDVVSGGELERAVECGIAPENIVFSGVAKTVNELRRAIGLNIGQINIESLSELKRLCQIAQESSSNEKVSIALRVNPAVEVKTHKHITTGSAANKFGLDLSSLSDAIDILKSHSKWVSLRGLAVHVGSQIFDFQSVLSAIGILKETVAKVNSQGFTIDRIDIGGGLGVDYKNRSSEFDQRRLDDYGRQISAQLRDWTGQIIVEPGRYLVARAGLLLGRVECLKSSGKKEFIILNTGIHHLIRPALYEAHHEIVQLESAGRSEKRNFDVVGPLCESSDVLGESRSLYPPKEGEWLAILDAGAYGFSMANQYNLRQLPEEVVIE